MDPKIQNTYRHKAMKHIKQIKTQNKHNTLHKRQQYTINELKKTFQNNIFTIARADKSKAIDLINKNNLKEKVHEFIQENNIKQINRNSTDKYQKQTQQTLQKCKLKIEKKNTQISDEYKTQGPQLNAYVKTHKDNAPIRPAINHTQAPSHKLARHLNKRL